MRHRLVLAFVAAALLTGSIVALAGPAAAASSTARVTNDHDTGPGSFRAAVEAANTNPQIIRITFDRRFGIDLESEVAYTGAQNLRIDGDESTLSGGGDPAVQETWDSGLFVSRSDADLDIRDLDFANSANNGLAVFLPPDSDDVRISLRNVHVSNSQFFGVLVDGQSSSGYNTDDFIHPNCEDPHPVDAGADIVVSMRESSIENSGDLDPAFDITQSSGCPQDFDGLRVDQGGEGSIVASISGSRFVDNLSDGAELDEKGPGRNQATVRASRFIGNGVTASITCDVEGDEEGQCGADYGDLIQDPDDGLDMDEEGEGDMIAFIEDSVVNDNLDQGLDLDEAGDGDARVTVTGTTASFNATEGLKVSEEDAGSVFATVKGSHFDGAPDNDNAQIEEEGEGDNTVSIEQSSFDGSGDGDGLKATEDDGGNLTVSFKESSARNNDDDGIQVEQGGAGSGVLSVRESTLSGNGDDAIAYDGLEVVVSVRETTL